MRLVTRGPLPPPPPFDWPTRPLAGARVTNTLLADGRRDLTIEHDLVRGVTPPMLHWWFGHIEGTVEVAGAIYPRYRVWHPRDHIRHEIVRWSPSGTLGPGAAFRIVEALGRDRACFIDIVLEVEKLDQTGIRMVKRIGGIQVFSLEHRFVPVADGTRYLSRIQVGLASPAGQAALNRAIRRWLFTDERARALFRHNVEEVGNFEHFLPALFARCARETDDG